MKCRMKCRAWGFLNYVLLVCTLPASSSGTEIVPTKKLQSLIRGSSLTPEHNTTCLVSPNETFSAGFYRIGNNAYGFGIWFTRTADRTVVWMANRDEPVNGRNSVLGLQHDGDFVLSNANGTIVWSTGTGGMDVKDAVLLESGNLVLRDSGRHSLWESFKHPTDTLLPSQPLTGSTQLISRIGLRTFRSGYYRLYFDNDNVLRLIYVGLDVSSIYWPHPYQDPFQNGRTTYNSTRYAVLDESGRFISSDKFEFNASDFGERRKRRLTMDIDGNLRLYSLNEASGGWNIVWVSVPNQCKIHGRCGPNGICIYTPEPKCTCTPGFHMVDWTDWFKGCRRNQKFECGTANTKLILLPHTDYYGSDFNGFGTRFTLEDCKDWCMKDCSCQAFAYRFDGTGTCYPKSFLLNGIGSASEQNYMYIKISMNDSAVRNTTLLPPPLNLNCSSPTTSIDVSKSDRRSKSTKSEQLKYPLGFVAAIGVTEIACITLGWCYFFRKYSDPHGHDPQGYHAIPTMFKRFTFGELRTATNNFRVELGKGGFGTVYKGTLPDKKVVAVKRLEGVSQGESQFWAEVTIIGRIHHMNLVRIFGFCAEGEHRLLVYEYVENGSLDKYLFSSSNDDPANGDQPKILDWNERFGIAVGVGKGLAYLHEECLEWILHCDVKPQNILLDAILCPKVSDFGLAKLVEREQTLSFSTVRGTRGYLAPEWMMNLPITAKADVYSFGIVLLEMVTGRSASTSTSVDGCADFVQWMREKMKQRRWMNQVVDPKLDGNFDPLQLERVVRTALLCVEQDKDSRPSMSKAVEMLSQSPDYRTVYMQSNWSDERAEFRSLSSSLVHLTGSPLN